MNIRAIEKIKASEQQAKRLLDTARQEAIHLHHQGKLRGEKFFAEELEHTSQQMKKLEKDAQVKMKYLQASIFEKGEEEKQKLARQYEQNKEKALKMLLKKVVAMSGDC
ncbi:MAG: hypothetical protein LBV67_02135 [Streptococcaceae bacterium]|jgi:vacuolar-type H+-ATPase subunit H|nr:hypothetical protein [Streptococcaceae bacterium]